MGGNFLYRDINLCKCSVNIFKNLYIIYIFFFICVCFFLKRGGCYFKKKNIYVFIYRK